MNITLSPEAEKLVNDKVESGEYTGASEVLDDALRALEMSEARDYKETVEGIRRGLEEAGSGKGRPAPEFFSELRHKHGIPR